MNTKEDYVQELESELTPLYTVPNVEGGHDCIHVKGVLSLGEKILPLMKEKEGRDIDPYEYKVAAWFHNLDRCKSLEKSFSESGGLESWLQKKLSTGPFEKEAQMRIIKTVLEHSKKDDDLEHDPSLLTALRIADKLDRFTPLIIFTIAAHRADLPHIDVEVPFIYETNRKYHLKYIFWILEWYHMLPYDWARDLIDKDFIKLLISFARETGRDVAKRLNIKNQVEKEIEHALGPYYSQFSP